jgi:hypothetical protein
MKLLSKALDIPQKDPHLLTGKAGIDYPGSGLNKLRFQMVYALACTPLTAEAAETATMPLL